MIYVLAAEKRGGEPLTMGDALAELLADITEAARSGRSFSPRLGDANATHDETLRSRLDPVYKPKLIVVISAPRTA